MARHASISLLSARCTVICVESTKLGGTDEILCCCFVHDSGYVQGMSDLCAPVYVVSGADEAVTFWCFVSVMDRMVRCPALFSPS